MAIPSQRASDPSAPSIAAVVADMQERLDRLPARLSHLRVFLTTYQRTTRAVGEAIERASFEDPEWVEHWDVVFADLYPTLELQDPRLAGPQQYAVRLAAPRGHLKGRPWSGRTRVIAVGGPTQRLATFADRGRGMRFLVVRVTDRLS
jgi:Family of unknown function (DUF5995)